MAQIKIDVFTDVVCPWCLVGSARLDAAVAALPQSVGFNIEHHPFYLDASTPPEGVVVADMLRQRYGREPAEMWARVEAEAKAAGIFLDLSRQPRMFPTAKAHTLTRLARPLGTQHALANAIAESYFLKHRDINDDEVLAGLGAAHGFARQAALSAIRDPAELAATEQLAIAAAQSGIAGVPFFIFDGRLALSGAQPQSVFDQALRQVLAA